jgi:hypothetical protein
MRVPFTLTITLNRGVARFGRRHHVAIDRLLCGRYGQKLNVAHVGTLIAFASNEEVDEMDDTVAWPTLPSASPGGVDIATTVQIATEATLYREFAVGIPLWDVWHSSTPARAANIPLGIAIGFSA